MLAFMSKQPPERLLLPRWLLIGSGLVVIVGGGFGLRHGLLAFADSVGYAVCHQITVRTYLFGELAMPLCARCSGQYLGALAGFFMALVWGRIRASSPPSRGLLAVLLLFLAVWAFDGVNSYIYLITGAPFLYQPTNLLRLITGLCQGIAVSMLFLPFFNQVFWRRPDPRPVLQGWRDLGAMILLAALLALAVHSRWPFLFYPLALLSILGVLLLLTLVGILLVVLAFGQENQANSIKDFALFLAPGLAFALMLIVSVNILRAWMEAQWGVAFPQG